jgi:hypothetical protein
VTFYWCCRFPCYQRRHQPDGHMHEGWRKFYRLLKKCLLPDRVFENLCAKLIYFTNLQRAHPSLWVILFLPEKPKAKTQASRPN